MKKNIDNLFKDKFKHAEITPPEEVWESISAELPFKKRNKRIIPIWYLIAGTAAAIAIMVMISIDNSTPISNQKITDTPEYPIIKTNSDKPEVPKFKESEMEPLFENNDNVVQTKIKNPESNKNQKPLNNIVIDDKPQISKNRENNTPKTEIAANIRNKKIESRTEESLNSEYKLSQLIQNEVEIVADDSITPIESHITDNEELFNKEEVETSLKTSISKRLSVTTTAGALYFDDLSVGNGGDEAFSNNKVSNEITTSYGINFGYQISRKVKIRTGISQIKLVSNTENVSYFSIDNSQVIEEDSEFASIPSDENEASVLGKLNQNIGFIEVPSEVEYSIINRKFGINLIGGFSTLFLNKNTISLNIENSTTNIGKAKNLNEISFTANAGLGITYKISPQFNINLEPTFKYQLNTFKETKNFNPYYFGIYSGLSFKF